MLDLTEIRKYLHQHEADGWLLYDYKGLNRLAQQVLGTSDRMITRRWFYWIPRTAEPTLLLHRIDSGHFPEVTGKVICYTGWADLHRALKALLGTAHSVLLEYSPEGAIPNQSFVDAGTVELVTACGPRVASSADLIQFTLCRWTEEQIASHQRSAEALTEIVQQAFQFTHESVVSGQFLSEYEVQQFLITKMAANGLDSNQTPIVAVGKNTGDPHYLPNPHDSAQILLDQPFMIDIWSRELRPDGVFADITWMAFIGHAVSSEFETMFSTVLQARDRGIQFIKSAWNSHRDLKGFEVDRCVREVIDQAGFGKQFIHRTGHSLGARFDHGDGANLDDLETHDTRSLIPGTAFSIEPGIYCQYYGVRSEINMVLTVDGPRIFTPVQDKLILL